MVKVDVNTKIDALERLVAFHTKSGNQEKLDEVRLALTEVKAGNAKQELVRIA